jgi:hypothetical protein
MQSSFIKAAPMQTLVGFRLRFVDRLMCRSYSELIGMLFGELCGIVLLLSAGRAFARFAGASSSLSPGVIAIRAMALVAIASPFGIGAWWTVHTWRRLWRCGRTKRERLIYDYGVRSYGVIMAIAIICIVAWLGWTEDAASFGPMMTAGVIASVFFGVPISLNMGYFWGKTFATIVGVEAEPRAEAGEPPHVSEMPLVAR